MLAGHETTASTMNWVLWELSKDVEYQALCREEIASLRSQVVARGEDDFSMADLENMPHVTAVIKVSGCRQRTRPLPHLLTTFLTVGNAPVPSDRLSPCEESWPRRYHPSLDSDTDEIWSGYDRNPGQQGPERHCIRLCV